jgi:hypothetical protein
MLTTTSADGTTVRGMQARPNICRLTILVCFTSALDRPGAPPSRQAAGHCVQSRSTPAANEPDQSSTTR